MPTHVCPACHKRFAYTGIETHPTYPFCSRRCRLAELGAWLDGRYVIPDSLEEAGDGDLPETTDDSHAGGRRRRDDGRDAALGP